MFFHPGETRVVKGIDTRKLNKKVHLFTFQFFKLNLLTVLFTFNLFRLFWETENLFPFF